MCVFSMFRSTRTWTCSFALRASARDLLAHRVAEEEEDRDVDAAARVRDGAEQRGQDAVSVDEEIGVVHVRPQSGVVRLRSAAVGRAGAGSRLWSGISRHRACGLLRDLFEYQRPTSFLVAAAFASVLI